MLVSPAPNRPTRAVRSGAECVGSVESSLIPIEALLATWEVQMMVDFGSYICFKRALRRSLGRDLAPDRVEALSGRLACGFGTCLLGSTRHGLNPLGSGGGDASGRSRCHWCNVPIKPPTAACTQHSNDPQTDQTQVSPAPNRPQRAVRSGAEWLVLVETSSCTTDYLRGQDYD